MIFLRIKLDLMAWAPHTLDPFFLQPGTSIELPFVQSMCLGIRRGFFGVKFRLIFSVAFKNIITRSTHDMVFLSLYV